MAEEFCSIQIFPLNVSDGNRMNIALMNMAIQTIKLSLSSDKEEVEMNTKLWQEIIHEKARESQKLENS